MKQYTVKTIYNNEGDEATYDDYEADNVTISDGVLRLHKNGEVVLSQPVSAIKSLDSIDVNDNKQPGQGEADHSHRHEMTEVGNPTELDKTRYGQDGEEPGDDVVTPDNPDTKLVEASGNPDAEGTTLRNVHESDHDNDGYEVVRQDREPEKRDDDRDGFSNPDAADPASLD